MIRPSWTGEEQDRWQMVETNFGYTFKGPPYTTPDGKTINPTVDLLIDEKRTTNFDLVIELLDRDETALGERPLDESPFPRGYIRSMLCWGFRKLLYKDDPEDDPEVKLEDTIGIVAFASEGDWLSKLYHKMGFNVIDQSQTGQTPRSLFP